MVKAVLWDNDGVLVDTEALYYEATRTILASAGIPLPLDDYRRLFLKESRGAWHLAAEKGVSPRRIEELRAERDALYSRLLAERNRALPGAAEVLAALHQRLAMGVVTSSRRNHFDIIHRATGFSRFFDFVVTSDDVPQTKPRPEPYLAALARAGCAPHEAVAVEDSERGLAAARAAGIPCWVLPSSLTLGGDFTGAARILSRITEVPELLAR